MAMASAVARIEQQQSATAPLLSLTMLQLDYRRRHTHWFSSTMPLAQEEENAIYISVPIQMTAVVFGSREYFDDVMSNSARTMQWVDYCS
jgi:hypothetical protein